MAGLILVITDFGKDVDNMPRTAYEKLATKNSIKIKFLDMYKAQPLNQINVSDLARVCNISRGTFYFYFEDICALYNEYERDLIGRLEEGLPELMLCTVGLDFEKYVDAFGKHLNGYPEYADVIKCFLLGSESASFRDAWFESIYRNFEQPMSFLRVPSHLQRDNLVRFFAGGQLSIFTNWVLTNCREPAENIAYISAQALFRGIFWSNKS
jgi:AcrR family transcriptional regulator